MQGDRNYHINSFPEIGIQQLLAIPSADGGDQVRLIVVFDLVQHTLCATTSGEE